MRPPLTPPSSLRSCPDRRLYDSTAERLQLVVDVLPATADDLEVRVGADRVVVALEGPTGRSERSFRPPRRRVFDGDRRAIYHNGVLELTLETRRRGASAAVDSS